MMSDSHQLSVSWTEYLKNVCNGLWSLQQHGEFVDMTLAADGHHVKVHKMLLSLASPYIKELITTADCAHPIIFLNQVSYTTLCLLLEYIYTGEVVVPREHFKMFMEAGQALHIKGLQAKVFQQFNYHGDILSQSQTPTENSVFTENRPRQCSVSSSIESEWHIEEDYFGTTDFHEDNHMENHEDNVLAGSGDDNKMYQLSGNKRKKMRVSDLKSSAAIQYSLSNQGNLQLVMNRYLYNVKYISRRANRRKWQCIDGHWRGLRCPAIVVTLDNMVQRRCGVHNHPFHDEKILKKIQAGVVFTDIKEAEREEKVIQGRKEKKVEIKENKT